MRIQIFIYSAAALYFAAWQVYCLANIKEVALRLHKAAQDFNQQPRARRSHWGASRRFVFSMMRWYVLPFVIWTGFGLLSRDIWPASALMLIVIAYCKFEISQPGTHGHKTRVLFALRCLSLIYCGFVVAALLFFDIGLGSFVRDLALYYFRNL